MAYNLDFTKKALRDLSYHKKSGNIALRKKIHALLEEQADHPKIGKGKPEILKHELSGLWSRRINKEHRLIYEIKEDKVLIISAKGHY